MFAQQDIEIQARIESATYDTATGIKQSQRNFSVICIIGSNTWTLENDFMINGEETYRFDGTNIYRSIRQTTNESNTNAQALIDKLRVKRSSASAVERSVTTYVYPSPGGHPLGNPGANIPWLAFCSANYLKQTNRLIPIPIALLSHAPDGFAYTDKTEYFDEGDGLPKAIALFASVDRLKESVKLPHFRGSRDETEFLRNHPSFKDNELMFHYLVKSQTNVVGKILPVEFEWIQNYATSDGRLVRRFDGSGKVVAIRSSGAPLVLLQTNKQNVIIDYRVSVLGGRDSPLRYLSTNASLLPTNNPKLQELLAAKRRKLALLPKGNLEDALSPPTPVRPWIKRIILTVFAVSVILIIILYRRNTNPY